MNQYSDLIEMLTNIMSDIKKIERKLNQMEIVMENLVTSYQEQWELVIF